MQRADIIYHCELNQVVMDTIIPVWKFIKYYTLEMYLNFSFLFYHTLHFWECFMWEIKCESFKYEQFYKSKMQKETNQSCQPQPI